MSSNVPYGYDIDEIDAPKYMSRGEWSLTGTKDALAYWPMKADPTLTSGLFGTSGLYDVTQWCLPYDNISGLSGCIGVNIRKISKISETGNTRNQNLGNRSLAILHEGYIFMSYESGTLDGALVTLRYGDAIAPCTSGFRVYQELNITGISGIDTPLTQGFVTGDRQVKLGWYADVPSNLTGVYRRVKIMPNRIYGVHP